jgi:hypothetical protein
MQSLRLVALVLLPLLVAGCRGGDERDRAAWLAGVRFVDVTDEAGVARSAPTYDAAVGDVDGDGALDLYVGNHGTGAVLLRNRGDGTFADVLPASGIAAGGDQHGTGFADFDGDGRLDLYVSVGANRGLGTKANRLYRNRGDGTFDDVVEATGVADPRGRARAVAWLDADADGALDLVLANFASPNRFYRNRGDGTFEDVSDASGLAAHSATRIAWGDVDGDGYPDVLLGGTPRGLRLLRNEEGPTFRDATREAGLEPIAEPVQGFALGDWDNDGDLDLATSFGVDFTENVLDAGDGTLRFAFFAHDEPVGFDFETLPGAGADVELYENGSPAAPDEIRCGEAQPGAAGRFTCPAAQAARAAAPGGEVAFLLWREPGDRGCRGCGGADRWHLRWHGKGDHHLSGVVRGASNPRPVGLRTDVPRGAAVWRNDGGAFVRALDVGRGLPAAAAVNGQAVQWADVDADGWLDLYLVDSGVDGAGARNVLLMNEHGERFVAMPSSSGASPDSGAGRGVGAHFADLDRDGRTDLFLTNGWGAPPFDRGPYRLLRNASAGGHWITLELRGRESNRHGLGAWIEIEACGERRMRYHDGGTSTFSQSVTPPLIGLGSCEEVERIVVHWPSGRAQVLLDVEVDRLVEVVEDS